MKRFAWIFLLFLTFAGFAFAPAAHALQPTNDLQKFLDIVDDKSRHNTVSSEWYTTNQVGSLQAAPILYLIGGSNDQASIFYYKKSALAYMDGVITGMYQSPPANLALWIQDTGQSLGFIPNQAYAQGIGFNGFTALLDLWKAFRNIAYAILAAVMIVIGFMVMFRQKIDPKTVVTVQNALPRIVITLLLITFSYAIVGLMIDLMYVLLLFVTSALVAASHNTLNANTASSFLAGGFGTLFNSIFGGALKSLNDIVAFFSPSAAATQATTAVATVVGVLSVITGAWTPALVVAGVPILALLIVAIILLFAVIRLMFLLVGAYVQIIISLLTGPFQLLAGAIPGNNAFGSWIKNLAANLLVFPITAGLLLVANILASLEKNPTGLIGTQGQGLWVPPLLGGSGHGIAGVIALGMLLSIPSIVNGIKESFKTKPLVPAGGFGGIAGLVGTTAQYGAQFGMGKYQTEQMRTTLQGLNPPGKQDDPIKAHSAKPG